MKATQTSPNSRHLPKKGSSSDFELAIEKSAADAFTIELANYMPRDIRIGAVERYILGLFNFKAWFNYCL